MSFQPQAKLQSIERSFNLAGGSGIITSDFYRPPNARVMQYFIRVQGAGVCISCLLENFAQELTANISINTVWGAGGIANLGATTNNTGGSAVAISSGRGIRLTMQANAVTSNQFFVRIEWYEG